MRPLIYISSFLCLLACNQTKNNKQKSNLKIGVNANYIKYLGYPTLQIVAKDSIYYDSTKNLRISSYDSIRNGKIKISIFSLLTNDFEPQINLQKDTTINFDTTIYSSLKTTNSIKEFRTLSFTNLDTIYFGQKIVGCFGGSLEKIKIYKLAENYKIEYYSSEKQELFLTEKDFENLFIKFLNESKKLFPDKVGGLTFVHLSTTHIDTYLRQGNYILEYPDLYDWKGYDNFKKSLGIKTSG